MIKRNPSESLGNEAKQWLQMAGKDTIECRRGGAGMGAPWNPKANHWKPLGIEGSTSASTHSARVGEGEGHG